MKTLQDLIKSEGLSSLSELIDKELVNTKEPFKTQKKQLVTKLTEMYDGDFLDGFEYVTFGNFLSRALTAYVISNRFGVDKEESVQCITDDVRDYGIDALYIQDDKIYVFQTKFSNHLDEKDLRQIKDGFTKLLNIQNNINAFNSKICARKDTLFSALLKDNTVIIPVCVFMGDDVPKNIRLFYNSEVTNKPEYDGFIKECIFINKGEIFEYEITPRQISEDFILDNYFCVTEPIKMYAGCVKVNFLKNLFNKHGINLFNKNIRFAIKDSSINEGLQSTIYNYPDKLLYYHNGITFICEKIKEKPISATSNSIKNLSIIGLSVVNGAQTISSLRDIENINDNALIQIRIIETQDINITTNITQYNNSQNAVSTKDLCTLDPIHKNIKRHFLKNGFYYTYKTGEPIFQKDKIIDFEDLMIGLACYYGFSRIAKFNKGQLWENKKTYKDLLKIEDFDKFLYISQTKLLVDECISKIAETEPIIKHYNRLILDIIFAKHPHIVRAIQSQDENVPHYVENTFALIQKYVKDNNQNLILYHRKQGAYEKLKNYCLNKEQSAFNPIQLDLL
ncbi:MAG: AIPR family protein [Alphaproteobacteria bacterium]|nr:AIPR family protein [Alphaproteobacteria bacterium]